MGGLDYNNFTKAHEWLDGNKWERTFDEWNAKTRLYHLFWMTSEIADNYDSDSEDGEVDKGTYNSGPDISDPAVNRAAKELMPLAMISIAELYKLFWEMTHPESNINQGLVGFYDFNGSTNDFSGINNHGTAYNGTNYVQGVTGQAANFDGVDDYVKINNKSAFNSGDFTIAAWVKSSQGFYILSQWTASTTADNFIFLVNNAGNYLQLSIRKEGSSTPATLTSTSLNVQSEDWILVAVTYDESEGKCVFYANNQSQAFTTGFSDRTISTSPEIYIGRKRYLDNEFTQGNIDNLKIYNRVLSGPEILSLYDSRTVDNSRLFGEYNYTIAANQPSNCTIKGPINIGSDFSRLNNSCSYLYIPTNADTFFL